MGLFPPLPITHHPSERRLKRTCCIIASGGAHVYIKDKPLSLYSQRKTRNPSRLSITREDGSATWNLGWHLVSNDSCFPSQVQSGFRRDIANFSGLKVKRGTGFFSTNLLCSEGSVIPVCHKLHERFKSFQRRILHHQRPGT